MKTRLLGTLVLGVIVALPSTSGAQIILKGVVVVPGNPITSSDISWVDPGTERTYVTDRSNFGVDIIDAENNLFVGRVTGMVGVAGVSDGTHQNNGSGPNGVFVTNDGFLWAGDGDSKATVADVNPGSPSYLQIVAQIDTSNAECDDGTDGGHWCQRLDEGGFDPVDRIVMYANNGPLSPTQLCPTPANPNAHCPVDPYVTLIDANTYGVLGQIIFPGVTGIEQPLWHAGLGRFLLTVPGSLANNILPSVAVIDPTTCRSDGGCSVEQQIFLDCMALVGTTSQSVTGIAGAADRIIVSACGQGAPLPAVPSFPIILNPYTQAVVNIVTQVGGGDQVWFNPGDGHFYVTGTDLTGATGLQSLGAIDAQTGNWLQNITDVRGKNPSAFHENNEVFTVGQITAAIVANPALDDSVCTQFGWRGLGCIAIFGTEEPEDR